LHQLAFNGTVEEEKCVTLSTFHAFDRIFSVSFGWRILLSQQSYWNAIFIAALKMLYDGKNYTIAWSDMTMTMTLQKMRTNRTATMMAYVF